MSLLAEIKYLDSYDLKEWGPIQYAKPNDSCFDVRVVQDGIIYPKRSAVFNCGVCFKLPKGCEMQIRSRSGLAFKHDIQIHVGTLDEDFIGELYIKVFNFHYHETFKVTRGMRLAQAKILYAPQIQLVAVDNLSDTIRGNSGLGSSGIF